MRWVLVSVGQGIAKPAIIVRTRGPDRVAQALRPMVLIIDEDETTRDLYGHWFIDLGFQVMSAVGTLGLSFALRRERPQLILAELRAGDLTFADLVRRLQSDDTTRCIPVIAVTTSTDAAAIASAKAAGAATVLPKFVDFETLRSWVTSLVCPRLV